MLRKPHYCCNCGEIVDRAVWRWWNSRRFCELCETEFVFEEWWPRAVQSVVLLIGLVALGVDFFERKPDPPKVTRQVVYREAPKRIAKPVEEKRKRDARQVNENSRELEVLPRSSPIEKRDLPVAAEKAERISYCGVITKKGTPCSRRVKEGARCWQHRENDSPENP